MKKTSQLPQATKTSTLRVIDSSEDPFSRSINLFIQQEFPQQLSASSPDLMELLFLVIMGTKQTRYGPKPSPEAQVAIRDVIKHYIAKGEPIPFMVPWGSQKPDSSSIDIAELGALRVLECLNARVRSHYEPGVRFNIRLEDASAPYLYKEEADVKRDGAKRYVSDMEALVKVLGLRGSITLMPESSLTTEAKFKTEAEKHWQMMRDTIQVVFDADNIKTPFYSGQLAASGWNGGIAFDTIKFYLERYANLYPHRTLHHNMDVLARYFSVSLARKKLGVRGDCPAWDNKFIDLSFVPVVPGTDQYFGRRVQYRTLPSIYTRDHSAPWRSKGYLIVTGDGDVTPKLTEMSEQLPYNRLTTRMENGDNEVTITTDYIISS